ncbi:CidA/LrgA family protein [Bradyrhizobium sp. 2TAF24]|uniref:CidA/LrgA family protein n=1 Tax=Bradyrhizobium sp. 2TAF24 TaxID=3233011 RepID=UPI003F925A0D
MIASFSLILLCQLGGEIVVRAIGVPVPGPVLGFLALLVLLLARDRWSGLALGPLRPGAVEGASKALLANLSLLFVPAGVGVVQKLDLIAAHGMAIFAVLALSVVLTLLATVGTFLLTGQLLGSSGDEP